MSKWQSRRLVVAAFWAGINLLLIFLQPALHLQEELIKLFLEKSTWVASVFIVGVTGTDLAKQGLGNVRTAKDSGEGNK